MDYGSRVPFNVKIYNPSTGDSFGMHSTQNFYCLMYLVRMMWGNEIDPSEKFSQLLNLKQLKYFDGTPLFNKNKSLPIPKKHFLTFNNSHV